MGNDEWIDDRANALSMYDNFAKMKLNWQRRPTAMLNSGSHIVAKLRRVNQNERKHLIKFKTVAELFYQNMFICLGFG